MNDARGYAFGPFRLDTVLRHGERTLDLTPKAYAALRLLVTRAGEVVSRDELWALVWPGVIVTDAAMAMCVTEIRRALGDSARHPRYIATVHRRGYRFVAPVAVTDAPAPGLAAAAGVRAAAGDRFGVQPAALAGRAAETAMLGEAFALALTGRRQFVVLRGAPGIGKSALCAHFVASIATVPGLRIAVGQCVDHLGTPDAYLPLLDALNRLCHQSGGDLVSAQLACSAPLWLAQLPGLAALPAALPAASAAAPVTSDRMLLELTVTLEILASERPLLLWLEDLQWSDQATLAWLGFLARRPQAARLLVIATCRSTAVQGPAVSISGMLDELRLHERCVLLDVAPLTVGAIEAYLAARLAAGADGEAPTATETAGGDLHRLAVTLAGLTGGNALYVARVVDDLCARAAREPAGRRWSTVLDAATSGAVARTLKAVLTAQIKDLPPADFALAEAAAIAGQSFTAAAVAAMLGVPSATAEQACHALAGRVPWLCRADVCERPDGTLTTAYRFVHELYREIIVESIPPARAIGLHRSLAHAERSAYGARAGEVASVLARHFESGRQPALAAEYCLLAGHNALGRLAHTEAAACYRHGIALVDGLPPAQQAAHAHQALGLRLALGPVLIVLEGGGSESVRQCYLSAQSLAAATARAEDQFAATFGMRSVALARAELATAHGLGGELLVLAETLASDDLRLEAHLALGNTAFQQGDFATAHRHLQAAIGYYDEHRSAAHVALYGMDPGMFSLSLAALVHEIRGRGDEALALSRRARAVAERSAHVYSQATAANFAAWLHQLRDEPAQSLACADIAAGLAATHGFRSAGILARVRRGWAWAARGEHRRGIAEIETGIAEWTALGSVLGRPHFLALLADARLRADEIDAGLATARDALRAVERTDERWPHAELLRLLGQLVNATSGSAAEAVSLFEQSLAVASAQDAGLYAQRAARQLGRLEHDAGPALGSPGSQALPPVQAD